MRAIILLAFVVLTGCSQPHWENYDLTIANGKASIPSAAQFQELFPKSRHFITYYTGREGPSVWNSKAGIGNRYVLSMQFPITLDRANARVTTFGNPKFVLNEVTNVSQLPDGRYSILYGQQINFERDTWQKFVTSRGDLSVLGLSEPIQPTSRFDEIVDR